MNIKSTVINRPLSTGTQADCQLRKPDREWWWVEGEKYQSTLDMLDKVDLGGGSKTAHYVYQENSVLNKNPWKDFPRAVATGIAGGAALGTGLAIGAGLVGELLFLGQLSFDANLLAAAALGGVVGGVVASTIPFENHRDYKDFGKIISGSLVTSYDKNGAEQIRFHPNGDLNNSFDMKQFARSPVHSQDDQCKPWWKDRGYTPSPG